MIGVGVLLLAILMAGAVLTTATSTTNNDAPAAKVGPGAEVEIMNFNLTNNDYIVWNNTSDVINVSENLSEVYSITNGEAAENWTNVSSYDAVDGDAWNNSVDFIFYNASGTAAYNNSSDDWIIAGTNVDGNNKTNVITGFDTDWYFTALDNRTELSDDFNNSTDAIVYDYCDGEYDGFFGDNFTGINITNIADGDNVKINGSLANITLYNESGDKIAINTSSSGTNWINTSFAEAVAFNGTSLKFNVTMTVNDSTSAWYDNFDNVDAFDMQASAVLSLNASDKTIVNVNTIKASHVYLDSEYYAEDVTITITLEDDALNDDPNRIQEKTVELTSTSDVKTLDIILVETGADTGIFTADVITSSGTVSGNELHAEDGDKITVTNGDFNDTAEVDSSAPTDVTVDSPTQLQYNTSSDDINVGYSYTESNPFETTIIFEGPTTVEYVIDDSAESSDSVSVNENLDLSDPDNGEFEEGLYSIKLSVEDAAGNVNNTEIPQEYVLMIDDTGPSVNESTIANNITGTENYYNGYYNNSFAFNLTFVLEDNGEIDNDTVTLYYNNSTSESTIDLDNTTIVDDTATYKAIIDTQDDGMADNETIKFWVEANDTAGNTIVDGELVSYTVDTAAPTAPANLDAVAQTGVINLSWDASTDAASGVARYDIYRNETGTDFNFSGDDYIGSITDTSYTDNDTELMGGVNYNYTVVAVDNLGHENTTATSANATFVPGEPAGIELVPESTAIIADGLDEVNIEATIVDNIGRQIRSGDFTITFSTDAGILNETEQDTTGGNCTVKLISATTTGEANVTASLKDTDISSEPIQVEFVPDKSTFNLRAGWNMMSLPLIPADSSIDEVLKGIKGADVDEVWAYDAQSNKWTSYKPEEEEEVVGGELEEMVDGKGYFLKTDSAGNMTVYGYQDTKVDELPQAYDVYEGWNLIGFKYTENMAPEGYLGHVAGTTDRLYTFGKDLSPQNVRTLDGFTPFEMQPGEGYWLAVSQNGTIHPPGYVYQNDQ